MTALLVTALIATSALDAREDVREPLDPSAPIAHSEPQHEREWYGGPMLFLDAAAITAFLGGFPKLALPAYVLGGPIVHLAHRRAGLAFADLAVRVAVPAVAAAATLSVCHRGGCSDDTYYGVLAASMVVVALTDDLAFAHRDKPQAIPPSVLPSIGFSRGSDGRGRAALALAGAF